MIKIKNKLFAYGSAIVTSTLLVTWLFSQINGDVYAQTETDKLTFFLSSQKSRYVQLEPISFGFKLSNQTGRDIKWQGILTLGRDVDLIVQSAGGEERVIEGSNFDRAASVSTPKTLLPGRELLSGGLISGVSMFETIFPQPGTYQVRVKFKYKKIVGDVSTQENIISNPVSVTIDAPEGVNQQAYNYIKNTLERARNERRSTDELLALQENFVNTYGTSVYAKKVILDLASRYVVRGEDLKALRQLCKISGDNADYSDYVERTVRLIDVKLFPPDLTPLPINVPMPVRPHPCTRLVSQM